MTSMASISSIARPTLGRRGLLASAAPLSRPLVAGVSRTAALQQHLLLSKNFHPSSRRNILPPGPQILAGTVNDATHVPAPSPSHGSYHWTFERLIAAGLVPLTLAPFAAGSLNPVLDATLCAALLIHCHLGFQSIVIDYVPTARFPLGRRLVTWALNIATAIVGVGLYEFETNDVGLVEAVKRVWKA